MAMYVWSSISTSLFISKLFPMLGINLLPFLSRRVYCLHLWFLLTTVGFDIGAEIIFVFFPLTVTVKGLGPAPAESHGHDAAHGTCLRNGCPQPCCGK